MIGVVVAATLGYARGGYDVVVDEIVGPWFLDPFRAAARLGDVAFDYVVLRPNEAETIRRGVGRMHGKALRDESVISGMWKAFAALGPLENLVLDSRTPVRKRRCRRSVRASRLEFPPGLRYRFGRDHIDLCDMLSGFGASARPSLNEVAALLGVPAKLDGIDGSKVEALANAGRLDDIADYCLGDVITSFRLLLRLALVRGEIDEGLLVESEHSLDEAIKRQARQRPSLSAMRRGSKEGSAE